MRESIDVVPGVSARWTPRKVAWVRARLLDEIAARHVAFLAEKGVDPTATEPGWPPPGALFACAVKIATYPEIYGDRGYVASVIDPGGRDALRDLVGRWFEGLAGFHFFESGSRRTRAHARWLDREIAVARAGRHAPDVAPEGTL